MSFSDGRPCLGLHEAIETFGRDLQSLDTCVEFDLPVARGIEINPEPIHSEALPASYEAAWFTSYALVTPRLHLLFVDGVHFLKLVLRLNRLMVIDQRYRTSLATSALFLNPDVNKTGSDLLQLYRRHNAGTREFASPGHFVASFQVTGHEITFSEAVRTRQPIEDYDATSGSFSVAVGMQQVRTTPPPQ